MKKIYLLFAIIIFSVNANFAQNYSELFKKTDPSVVVIKVIESSSTGTGDPYQRTSYGSLGSGVLVDESGIILTAAHVVQVASAILVEFADGQQLKAEVHKIAPEADIAVIKTIGKPKNPTVAKLANSDLVNVGDPIYIIGSPMGLYHSLSVGYVSGRHTENLDFSRTGKIEFFQTDAAINQGNSGGPMFNINGEVIGIVSSILTQSGGFEGLGFVATSNMAKTIIENEGYNWMGIDAHYVEGNIAKILNIKQGAGFIIENVADQSPAYFMGLKGGYQKVIIDKNVYLLGGDILLSANDYKFVGEKGLADFLEFYQKMKSGDKLILKVLRAGEEIQLEWIIK